MKKIHLFPTLSLCVLLAAGCGHDHDHDHDHPHNGDDTRSNAPAGGNGSGGGNNGSSSSATPSTSLAGPHVKLKTPEAKVAARPTSMAAVTKHLDFGGSFYIYMSTEQILEMANEVGADIAKLVEQIAPAGEEKAQIQLALNLIKRGWRDSGLGDVSGLGASSFAVERGLNRNVAFLHHHPGKGDGLIWKMFGTQPHEQGGLKLMPASTLMAVHTDLDTALILNWLKDFIKNSGIPPLADEFEQGLEQANQQIGLEKLLATLDGEVGFVITLDDEKKITLPITPNQPVQIGHPGLVLSAKVKDQQILQFILQMLKAQDMPVQQTVAGGVTLHTIPVPAELPPGVDVAPTLFVSGGYLIVTSSQALAKEVIAVQQGQDSGLAGTPEFKKLAGSTDLKGNGISFVSSRYMTEFSRMMKGIMAESGGTLIEVTTTKWMSHPMLQSSGLSITRVHPDGILAEARATGAGYEVSAIALPAVAVTGIMASMLLPALAKAKQRANSIKSLNNAKQLSTGLIIFADENDGKLPDADKWCDLILRDVGSTKVFVSPQDPIMAARLDAGAIGSSYAFNAAVAGKNLRDLPHNTVIIFECPLGWNGVGGLKDVNTASLRNDTYANLNTIVVAFADGSARQVTFFDLEDLNWTGERRR